MTDRRKFLSSAAALTGSAVSSSAQGQEIRAGFIGVGARGGSLLKQTVTQQNVKVAAICDIDPETRDRGLSMAARNNPKSLTSWKAMLDLKDVDAVFIGTPCYICTRRWPRPVSMPANTYIAKSLWVSLRNRSLLFYAPPAAPVHSFRSGSSCDISRPCVSP